MTRAAGGLVDVGDFTDTGWLPIDLATNVSAVSGYTPEVRLRNGIVNVRGRGTYSGAWGGTQEIGFLPDGYDLDPDNIIEGGPVMYGLSSSTGRLFVNGLTISIGGGSTIGTAAFYLSPLFWMVD